MTSGSLSSPNLWFPHVYIPNQNPADITGSNAFGRWDYGPWFWPSQDPTGFVGKPYACDCAVYPPGSPPAFPPLMCPGTLNPYGTPEGFMDTPVINGALYSTLTVDSTSYRFQRLMAGNDRTWNLGLYVADPLAVAVTSGVANYTLPPLVSFTGGGGTGATAVTTITAGRVTAIIVTNTGSGYTTPLTVRFTGGGGGCARATANLTGVVNVLLLTNDGTGYTSHPTVSFTGGGGTGTAATDTYLPGTVASMSSPTRARTIHPLQPSHSRPASPTLPWR